MGRAENVWGPYEKDPKNPIVTSVPGDSYERHDPDHLKPKYYNPASVLHKSGHGSYVETQNGEVYLVHLTSRPFVPELRCTLGRETAIQKMVWTEDNWLRMADGSNLAKVEVPEGFEEDWQAYDIEVSLEVEDGKFSNITVSKGDGYDSSNDIYFNKAVNKTKGIQTLLVGKDATEDTINGWDVVSGATCTSDAVDEGDIFAAGLCKSGVACGTKPLVLLMV